MKAVIIGCGYVADFYMSNAKGHSNITVAGAYDSSPERLEAFRSLYLLTAYKNLDEVLADSSIELVLNLTNPRSHYAITKACLNAGKHVYSEKPLAMTVAEAKDLAAIAKNKNVRLACAPCSVLSSPAQTIWKALLENEIGQVRLVYANYEDGLMSPPKKHWLWKGPSGAVWPARDEFEIGCTYEHAGYFLTWLAAFWGPARRVTAFSSCQVPDKGIKVESMAPDFSVGCLEYDNGVVARVTCGLVAPDEKALMIMGDKGYIFIDNLRHEGNHVYLTRYPESGKDERFAYGLYKIREKFSSLCRHLPGQSLNHIYPPALNDTFISAALGKNVDFMRGPGEMVDAITEGRPHRLSAELGVHIVELIEALQHPDRHGYHKEITTTFPKMDPLVWR